MKIIKFVILITLIALIAPKGRLLAVSSTPTPTPTKKLSTTPVASPSAGLTPTGSEDEKVQEVRQAIKDKLNEIKDKVEKKAYVGIITEITDSTLTISNFRGKERIRIAEDTIIIDANKKEIKASDLAVDDKVIALGEVDPNETLVAKRVTVVLKPKVVAPKRQIFFGSISEVDSKGSLLTIVGTKDKEITLKIDTKTFITSLKDAKLVIKLKDIKPEQKVIAVYPETVEGKTPVAIDLFLLQ